MSTHIKYIFRSKLASGVLRPYLSPEAYVVRSMQAISTMFEWEMEPLLVGI